MIPAVHAARSDRRRARSAAAHGDRKCTVRRTRTCVFLLRYVRAKSERRRGKAVISSFSCPALAVYSQFRSCVWLNSTSDLFYFGLRDASAFLSSPLQLMRRCWHRFCICSATKLQSGYFWYDSEEDKWTSPSPWGTQVDPARTGRSRPFSIRQRSGFLRCLRKTKEWGGSICGGRLAVE